MEGWSGRLGGVWMREAPQQAVRRTAWKGRATYLPICLPVCLPISAMQDGVEPAFQQAKRQRVAAQEAAWVAELEAVQEQQEKLRQAGGAAGQHGECRG